MSFEERLESLQRDLARIDDLITAPRRQSSSDIVEFLVLKLDNIKLKMYQEGGHATPHIHIDYGKRNHVASFAIDQPARIKGSLDRKYDASIIAWISANREALLVIWKETQSGVDPVNLVAELSGNA